MGRHTPSTRSLAVLLVTLLLLSLVAPGASAASDASVASEASASLGASAASDASAASAVDTAESTRTGTVPAAITSPAGLPALEDADRELASGETYWQGQNVSALNTTDEIDDRVVLREYDAEAEGVGSLVREIPLDDEGVVSIDTTDLEGTFVLVPADRRDRALVATDGELNGTVAPADADPFEVLAQTLEVRWNAGGSGTIEADPELRVESNRARYNVNVSSPDLTFEQLETAFMGDRIARDRNAPFDDRTPTGTTGATYEVHDDEDVIVLRGFSDGELRTDFGDLDALPGTFTVEVTDTGTADTTDPFVDGVGPDPFEIVAVDAPDAVDPGQSVTVSATVRNRWSSTERREVAFALGDDARTSLEVPIEGDGSTNVSATLTAPSEPGDVEYAVATDGDAAVGTLTVDGTDDDPDADPDDGTEPPSDGDTTDEEAPDENDGTDDGDASADDEDAGIFEIDVSIQAGAGALLALVSAAGVAVWRRR